MTNYNPEFSRSPDGATTSKGARSRIDRSLGRAAKLRRLFRIQARHRVQTAHRRLAECRAELEQEGML